MQSGHSNAPSHAQIEAPAQFKNALPEGGTVQLSVYLERIRHSLVLGRLSGCRIGLPTCSTGS